MLCYPETGGATQGELQKKSSLWKHNYFGTSGRFEAGYRLYCPGENVTNIRHAAESTYVEGMLFHVKIYSSINYSYTDSHGMSLKFLRRLGV